MPSSGAGEIDVLTLSEAVRRRPGMFFGDVRQPAGLMNYFLELISDLVTIRGASAVRIEIAAENTLRIEHNGRSLAATDLASLPACLVEKIAVSRFFHARMRDGVLSFRDGQATDPIALSDGTGLWCRTRPPNLHLARASRHLPCGRQGPAICGKPSRHFNHPQ